MSKKVKDDKVEVIVKITRQGAIYDPVVEMRVTKHIAPGVIAKDVVAMVEEVASNVASDAAMVYNRERFNEE